MASGATEAIEPLPPELPAALTRASAYPEDSGAQRGVGTLQTHISHLFLTAARVYKLRKAVRPGFLDFGTRKARNMDALREIELNRRLAPDVYLGLAPVWIDGAAAVLGPVSEQLSAGRDDTGSPEHCVVTRRLPDGRDALSLLRGGLLLDRHMDEVARSLCRFHEQVRLGTPAPFSEQEWLGRIERRALAAIPPLPGGAELRVAVRSFLSENAARFETRRLAGRAVDAHGDLHLEHIWFEPDDARPLFIDCLEFSDDLRRIDAASEVAFLSMDLEYRERHDLGERFLRGYASESDDFDLYAVVDFFASYRAAVRSLVAALAADDAGLSEERRRGAAGSATRHLALAEKRLAHKGVGELVLMCGIVGTGKSSAAEVAAEALEGVMISSDRVRKRLFGLAPDEHTHLGDYECIYTPERSARVYRGLLERAEPVIESGRSAILDAAHTRSAERQDAIEFARAREISVRVLETRCAEETTLQRLGRRERAGSDPSDAGPSFYARSAADFEPVRAADGVDHLLVQTDEEDWHARLREALAGP